MPTAEEPSTRMTLRSAAADHPEGKDKVKKEDKKDKKEKKDKKDKKEKKEKKDKKDKKEKKDKEKKEKRLRKEASSSSDESDSEDTKEKSKSKSKSKDIPKPAPKRARLDLSPPPADTPRDTTPEPGAEKEALDAIPENLRMSSYRISPATIAALASRGINALFPIQAETFDHIYDGNDVLGRARTGTGKTLAFALPMVEILLKDKSHLDRGRAPRVLVLAPTRDLAIQVSNEFSGIAPSLKSICVYGGTPMHEQTAHLRAGVDVVIGTPGRCLDHINRGNLRLDNVSFVCLDEADQMLDIGFAEDMEQVLQHVQTQKESRGASAPKHQTLLFSATAPEWIKRTVEKYLDPKYINVDLVGNSRVKTNENIRHYAIPSTWQSRKDVIGDVVAVYGGNRGLTVIFANTKAEADELGLTEKLRADAKVLHGDIPQAQRELTLQGFREAKVKCIICTDVLARGIDIPMVDLVINCQPPKDVETYVHRSGRTGRAGRKGVCVTFFKAQEEYMIQNIQRRAGMEMVKVGPPQPQDIIAATAQDAADIVAKVVKNVVPMFKPIAESMIEESFNGDATEALAAALAQISGYGAGVRARSLMSAAEGFTTMIFRLSHEIQHPGYVRNILTRNFPKLGYEEVKGMRMTKDMMGVVFDVVSEKVEVDDSNTIFLAGNKWTDLDNIKLEVAKTLPELEQRMDDRRGGGGGRGGFGGGRGGGFGGRGGFRGGRGGGGGGFRGGRGGRR